MCTFLSRMFARILKKSTYMFDVSKLPADISQSIIVAAQNNLNGVADPNETMTTSVNSLVAAAGKVETCHHHLQVLNITIHL